MYKLSDLRTYLTNRVQVATASATVLLYQDQAIGEMIDATFWRIMDVTYADLLVDGVTRRWALPGENITVLPTAKQLQPAGINTARIANPTTAPAVVGSGSGSTLLAGVYRCAFAYRTAYGETGISPVTTVTITAGQNLAFGALTLPTTTIPIAAVAYYYTDPNDVVWKAAASTGTGGAKTFTAPGSAPATGLPFVDYIPFSDVSWVEAAADTLAVEDRVNADATGDTEGATGSPVGTISASAAPGVEGGSVTVRVWYQRRVPQPDFTSAASVVRVPEQFARIATLGYYLGILSDNQPGGDVREWRQKGDEYLQQAQQLYQQAVPPVLPSWMLADAWLVGS